MDILKLISEIQYTYKIQSFLPKALKDDLMYIKIQNNGKSRYARKSKKGYYFSNKNNQYHLYRSSYELVGYILLDNNDTVLKYETETVSIPYIYRKINRNYIVDLFIHFKDGTKMLAEIKPEKMMSLPMNVQKFKCLKEYAESKRWKWDILTEKNLNIDNPLIKKYL